jgi:porin
LEKDDTGYPGNYQLGGLYVTGKTTNSSLALKNGNYMIYAMIDQMIYRKGSYPSKRGITPFISLLFAPEKDRNLFPFFFTSGIVFNGLIPKREKDEIAIGAAYGRFSRDLKEIDGKKQNAETVLEVNYKVHINDWFYFQPDIQYIITPNGHDSISNAWVFGFQSGLIF